MGAVRPPRRTRGSSLVELLVALAFVALVAAQLAAWMQAALAAVQRLETATGRSRDLWLGFDVVATDVRLAGFSASGDPLVGLAAADAAGLTLVHDANGDGDSDDGSERIRYRFDAAAGILRRGTGSAGLQVFVDRLGGIDVSFAFHDANGAPLAVPTGGLGAAARSAVRRIDLMAQPQNGGPATVMAVRVRNAG